MSKSRGSPRKFAEKIALLNKKEAEGTAEFVRILEEVKKETTRGPSPQPFYNRHHLHQNHHQQQQQQHQKQQKQQKQYWGLPTRSSSFSSRQTYARELYQPQPQPQPQPQQQQNSSQYLAEPIIYNPNNIVQQQNINCLPNSSQNLYIDQQQVQHQNAYIDRHQTPPAQQLHHHHNQQQQHLQQHVHNNHHHHQLQPQPHNQTQLTITTATTTTTNAITNHLSPTGNQHSLQPTTVEVPNIEIFPIDDEQHIDYLQQQVISAQNSPDSHLSSSDHYRQDCSPPSISSSRSLPNIANLSVSPTSTATSGISTTGQFAPQMFTNNQQQRSNMQALSATNISNHLTTSAELTPIISTSNDNSLDNYTTLSPHMNDYFSNDEYCSLPAIQEPAPNTTTAPLNRHDLDRQSQSSISPLNDGSWQRVANSSAPGSASPTPPAGLVQSPDFGMNQQQRSQSPNGQTSVEQQQHQHSPNGEHHLHQDYYSTSSSSNQQGQIVRRSSTNIIDRIHKQPNGDLLDTPNLLNNNQLSKSFEAHYGGYLDDQMMSDNNYTSHVGAANTTTTTTTTSTNNVDNYVGLSNHLELGGGGSGVGVRNSNPLSRSRSYNDIDQNFQQQNDCKRTTMTTTQYSNQQQQQQHIPNPFQQFDTQQQYIDQFYDE